MERGKWSELPAGRVSAAINRLLIALGDDAARVIPLINLESDRFVKRIARYAASQIGPDGHLISDPEESLLELVGTVTISATTEGFVAKDHFVVNIKRDAKVRISAIWDNFTTWFLAGDGKIEESIEWQTLCYHKLRQPSMDGPIIAELGGEEKSETTLYEMFSLMQKQANGENGVLLNNGWVNIFYIRDLSGVLRAVHVAWSDDGWSVGADALEDRRRWMADRWVFSRNSCKRVQAMDYGLSVVKDLSTREKECGG